MSTWQQHYELWKCVVLSATLAANFFYSLLSLVRWSCKCNSILLSVWVWSYPVSPLNWVSTWSYTLNIHLDSFSISGKKVKSGTTDASQTKTMCAQLPSWKDVLNYLNADELVMKDKYVCADNKTTTTPNIND